MFLEVALSVHSAPVYPTWECQKHAGEPYYKAQHQSYQSNNTGVHNITELFHVRASEWTAE